MHTTHEKIVLDFFFSIGDPENFNALLDQSFHPSVVQTGSFGNKVGVDEIKAYFQFREEIFSTASVNIRRLHSYLNFVEFELLFFDRHDRELSKETKKIALESNISPFVSLIAITPPTGKQTGGKICGTFVFHKEKVSYFNLTGETDQIVRQLFPKIDIPIDPVEKITPDDLYRFIQQRLSPLLTPIEIASIAFSIGGFNPHQSSIYLQHHPTTLETHLFSALSKLSCSQVSECHEKLSHLGISYFFQQLCHLYLT
ncbi:MAG: hypothetical protein H7A38_04525 [Chlamydiales bacterium]|nr:hypothetical protein [Chlamydiales bacterium]